MAEPILKWVGGKRQLLPKLVQLLPVDYKHRSFHEPFFGGGAFTFWYEPKRGSINDINPKLMTFYIVVRDYVDDLIEDARNHINEKEYYYRMRSEYNNIVSSEWFRNFVNRGLVIESDIDKRNAVRLSSLLLYLNKTAYNGLYRENKKGLFNVPFGRYKNPKIVDEERLYNASEILQRLNLYNTDFSYVLDVAKSGDIVYFDPPYLPVSRTANFTNYTSDGFSYNDHIRLRNVCIELHNRGVYFILSNSYTKKILELYKSVKDFEVFVVSANRFINSNAKKRKGAKEIIITNVPEEIRRGSII